jgi:hypothetical protein
MLRQRLRTRRFALAEVLLRVITVLVAVALIWYGAMTALLALKVSPHTINGLSAYRSVYDHLAGITAEDITARVRIIVAIAGATSLLVFGALAWRALPRTYLTRSELDLSTSHARGSRVISARALERVGELAALEHPLVGGAAARYGTQDITVLVNLRHATTLADTLAAVQQRVATALAEHDLPRLPINVTLTGVHRSNRRGLA